MQIGHARHVKLVNIVKVVWHLRLARTVQLVSAKVIRDKHLVPNVVLENLLIFLVLSNVNFVRKILIPMTKEETAVALTVQQVGRLKKAVRDVKLVVLAHLVMVVNRVH